MPDLVPVIDNEADQSILEHGLQSTVVKDSVVTLITFTNGGPGPAFIDGVRGNFNADGELFVDIDTVRKDSARATASNPTTQILFPKGQRLEVGQVLDVKGIHYLDVSAELRATLFGHR
jgi:hypothetical protein